MFDLGTLCQSLGKLNESIKKMKCSALLLIEFCVLISCLLNYYFMLVCEILSFTFCETPAVRYAQKYSKPVCWFGLFLTEEYKEANSSISEMLWVEISNELDFSGFQKSSAFRTNDSVHI